MQLSHTKLTTILNCPMTYYLKYKQGISLKVEKSALETGSAVHWGIEHDTEDLNGYVEETNVNRITPYEGGKELTLAEGIVHGYLKHKDELYEQILTDYDGTTKLKLVDEWHELSLTEDLPSHVYAEPHKFVGIIDLLVLTDKGFVVVDFKTSTGTPEYDKYLDQLYRYRYLLSVEFPDTPVYKIAVINLKKTQIRQKANENEESYLHRIKQEYEINDNNLIVYHEFNPSEWQENYDEYIENLIQSCDFAQAIDENGNFFINYANAVTMYGKSEYWDIFYNRPDAELLYKIKDHVWDEDFNDYVNFRVCRKIDLHTLHQAKPVLNHYTDYKAEFDKNGDMEIDDFETYLKNKYITDDELLSIYKNTLFKETA